MKLDFIHKENIDNILAKAKHYRLLNEPELAGSICLDILAVDKNNQEALIIYILTLIDQISNKSNAKEIEKNINLLTNDYHKEYYKGLFFERKARFFLSYNMSNSFAYDNFTLAIKHYQLAKQLTDTTNDDAILRINSCIRTIEKENLTKKSEEEEYLL